MQIYSAPVEFKAAAPTGEGVFRAIAASFGRFDRQGDTITGGAFARSLAEWRERKSNIPLLWQHDQNEPIGGITAASEAADGLDVMGKLALGGCAIAQRTHELMKSGGVSLSIGYTVPKGGAVLHDNGVRELKHIDLHEISVVAIPADPFAVIREVKSMSERELNDLMRERLGLSRRESKALLAGGYAALHHPEPSDEDLSLVQRRLQALVSEIKGRKNGR